VERKLSEDLLGDIKNPELSFFNDLIQLLIKHGFIDADELAEVLYQSITGSLGEGVANLIQAAILKREKK
jgi:predicted transcriptional regulator